MRNVLKISCLLAVMLNGLVFAAPQRMDNLPGSKQTSFVKVEDSASATPSLIAGVTGQYITIYKYTISVSTADSIYFKCGSSQVTATKYLGANSGLAENMFPLYIQCGSGDAFTMVKGTAGTPVGIDIWYTQR